MIVCTLWGEAVDEGREQIRVMMTGELVLYHLEYQTVEFLKRKAQVLPFFTRALFPS